MVFLQWPVIWLFEGGLYKLVEGSGPMGTSCQSICIRVRHCRLGLNHRDGFKVVVNPYWCRLSHATYDSRMTF